MRVFIGLVAFVVFLVVAADVVPAAIVAGVAGGLLTIILTPEASWQSPSPKHPRRP